MQAAKKLTRREPKKEVAKGKSAEKCGLVGPRRDARKKDEHGRTVVFGFQKGGIIKRLGRTRKKG